MRTLLEDSAQGVCKGRLAALGWTGEAPVPTLAALGWTPRLRSGQAREAPVRTLASVRLIL